MLRFIPFSLVHLYMMHAAQAKLEYQFALQLDLEMCIAPQNTISLYCLSMLQNMEI